jgi:hypothetical protein
MKSLACSLLAAALALVCSASQAESGPTPPVEILDSADAWTLQLSFDRRRFLSLFVTQEMLDSTHEPGREREELAIDRAPSRDAGRATLELAIGRRSLAAAPDGVHAQRVVIDAVPYAATDSVYHAQRTLYFRVSGGRAERIGLDEYSAVADPVHLEHDASGHEIPVHAGTAVLESQERAPDSIHYDIRLPE